MQIQVIILVSSLLAFSYATDNSDTPDILIGSWILSGNNTTSKAPCCQPTGDVMITNNGNGTVTLTSASWNGASCGARDSSFQDVISVNGSFSYNQIENQYDPNLPNPLPEVTDGTYTITLEINFSPAIGTTMSLSYNSYDTNACYTFFTKSAQIMSVFAAILIACFYFVIA